MAKKIVPLEEREWNWAVRRESYNEVDSFEDGGDFRIGNIDFCCTDMPGQCGAFILCDFSIKPSRNKVTAEKFAESLRHHANGGIGLLIASAVVDTPLHKLLNCYPWSKGAIAVNPNTKNKIQIFELKV